MTHSRGIVLIGLALAAALACAKHEATTSTFFPDKCNISLANITTMPPTLAVGDTVTLSATLLGPSTCLPVGATNADLRWSTGDTTIVTVDSVTGLVHARTPGGAMITLNLKGLSAGLAAVEVHVAGS